MNRSAPSSNEKTSKIDFHILLVFKLVPKELVHEHRLKRSYKKSVQTCKTQKNAKQGNLFCVFWMLTNLILGKKRARLSISLTPCVSEGFK